MNFPTVCVTEIIHRIVFKIDFLIQTFSGKYFHKMKNHFQSYRQIPQHIYTTGSRNMIMMTYMSAIYPEIYSDYCIE